MSLQAIINNVLGKTPTTTATTQPPAGAPQGATTAPAGTGQPATTQQPNAPPTTPLNDLTAFGDIFKPTATDTPNSQIPPKRMFPDFASKEMQGEVGKLDFARMIPPEAYAKLLTGDTTQFAQSLNGVMQQAMLYTMSGMSRLSEDAITSHGKQLSAGIPGMINAQRVQATLEQHPILSNPAIAPLREALTTKFTSDYPTASAEDIKAFTDKYLTSIATTVLGDQNKTNKPADIGTDWEAFAKTI